MQKIKLFISSPGDVEAERTTVQRVANQINLELGNYFNIHIEVIDWKTHVVGGMGRPQDVINRQIKDFDIFVGIMWKRFGTLSSEADSGTEEEFNIAYANWQKHKKPHILFYFSRMPYSPQNGEEISQWGKVIAFKEKLHTEGLIRDYESIDQFAELLRRNLIKLIQDRFPQKAAKKKATTTDFTSYLRYLQGETRYIDIRGLVTGEGKVHQFQIDELYIPLRITGPALSHTMRSKKKGDLGVEELVPQQATLENALKQKTLIIKGEPGAGKTTFLRLIAFLLCQRRFGAELNPFYAKLPWRDKPPLPLLIPFGKLTGHISEWKKKANGDIPTNEESPEWLLHFLDTEGRQFNWQVGMEDFRRELQKGQCLILLDGLDEAPDRSIRERMSALCENLLKAFPGCQIVLTSRPAVIKGKSRATDFHLVEIAPLDEPAMEAFFLRWSKALYREAPKKADAYFKDLREALRSRHDIRRMARTPVMLTALAVVHWNEHRLPEQRAELYESILTWLYRSREKRPGRLKADRCRKLLQKLALAMFTHPKGRQRQVSVRWAAEQLAEEFDESKENTSVDLAESFLRDEMVDSGIIAERANNLEFWHLSFQEYLAAYEIGGMVDSDQKEILYEKNRIFSSEWREVILLLGGVLHKQGEDKINYLINFIIDKGPKKVDPNNLPELAKNVSLLGGIVQDLSPFDFKPSDPDFQNIVRSVMGIFDKKTFRKISLNVRIEAADTLGQVGDPRLQGDPRVQIHGGIFWMGTQSSNEKEINFDQDAYERESVVHKVELSPFAISKYPITVEQYQRFIEYDSYREKQHWQKGGFGKYNQPENWESQLYFPSRPVVGITWYEAAAYASWAGGHLPTEAEWERAARGPGEKYRKYPWGNRKPSGETANFDQSEINEITPVGIFPENCTPEGAIDMAGNAWEWCHDWHREDYYKRCAQHGVTKNPTGPQKGKYRILRGGSYNYYTASLRCCFRIKFQPHFRLKYVGFRVAFAIL